MPRVDMLSEKIKQVRHFIFFTQSRLGLEARLFTLYKFRTMQRGREHEVARISEEQGSDRFGYIINDPRVTYIGRYLRMFWIDELPQIWNIIKRDMNLIGPRPLMPEDYEKLPDELKKRREKVRPGIIPVTYTDYFYINSLEDRCASEMRYFEERERNPTLTDAKYLVRALNTMFKLAKGNFMIEMYSWTNSYPYF